MEFFAQNYQISSILNKKKYRIPEFQREYSWGKEELEIFWDDIYGEQSSKSSFFGSIVLVGKNFNDNIGPFDVIDGQQRLTTFLLLINRIVHQLKKINEVPLADALRERLIFTDDNAKTHLSLENDNAHAFFQKILFHDEDILEREQNVECSNLLFAKEYFGEKIKDFDKDSLVNLRDSLLKINIIIVVQPEEDVAFEVFETLNFRGMDLNVLDLVKTFIVRNYPKQTGVGDPRDTWKVILKNIKDDKPNFFNRYWSSRFKKVSDPKIFKEFKKNVGAYTPADVKFFLSDIESFSQIYSDVMSPLDASWEKYCPSDSKDAMKIKSSVESMQKFQIKVHYSLLINALELCKEKKINQNQLAKLVDMLEKFHFVFNAICSKRPSGMDQRYSKYAIEMKRNHKDFEKIFTNLKSELRGKFPSDEEFAQRFTELNFEQDKGLILYSFRVLEKKHQPGFVVDVTKESLDHVSCQSEKMIWRHRIGNLILLEKDINKTRDNLTLQDSLDILKKTSYISTKQFIETLQLPWSEEKVDKRTKVLADELYTHILSSYF